MGAEWMRQSTSRVCGDCEGPRRGCLINSYIFLGRDKWICFFSPHSSAWSSTCTWWTPSSNIKWPFAIFVHFCCLIIFPRRIQISRKTEKWPLNDVSQTLWSCIRGHRLTGAGSEIAIVVDKESFCRNTKQFFKCNSSSWSTFQWSMKMAIQTAV